MRAAQIINFSITAGAALGETRASRGFAQFPLPPTSTSCVSEIDVFKVKGELR
jgi:hypothetical protein